MAEYVLIDGYVDTLRTRVRWRRDVDDLVAEVEDHLYSTVERLEATGTDTQLAQRKTLDRFGDPDLMADAFASTPRGGIAVPTKFTNTAGLAAIWAGGLWVVASVMVAAATYLSTNSDIEGGSAPFLVFAAIVIGAGVLTVMATAGLRERHGGLGALGMIGLIVLGLGVAATVVVAWALPFWMALQGVGLLFVALAAWPMRVAPRLPLVAYGSGMLLGSIIFGALTVMQVGSPDEFENYPVAIVVGTSIGFVITAAGLLGIGLWLRSEEPAPIDAPPDEALTA